MEIYLAGKGDKSRLFKWSLEFMEIYLAGAYNGNCSTLWRKALDALGKGGEELELYLAGGGGTRKWVIDEWIKNGNLLGGSNALGRRDIYP